MHTAGTYVPANGCVERPADQFLRSVCVTEEDAAKMLRKDGSRLGYRDRCIMQQVVKLNCDRHKGISRKDCRNFPYLYRL